MIFNITGGTAATNFKVVGGATKPTSPKENTIWINTEVEIPTWFFAVKNYYTATEDFYTKATIKTDYYINSTGEEASSTNFDIATIQLPKNARTITIEASTTSTTTVYHAFYDASGVLISTVLRGTGLKEYLVPANAVTARVSIRTNDIAEVNIYYYNEAPEGTVWICTGYSSPFEFNALKKNELQVYPRTVKQYVGNSWVDKNVLIYQNGNWSEWAEYLYNTGDKCVDITGDWIAAGWKYKDTTSGNGGTKVPDITWNNDHFVYDGTGNHATFTRGGCLLTTNDINLFGIKTISFHVLSSTVGSNNLTTLYIGVFKRDAASFDGTSARIATIQLDTQTEEAWYNIDVSSIDTTYAIGIAASSQAQDVVEVKIDKILYYLDEVYE